MRSLGLTAMLVAVAGSANAQPVAPAGATACSGCHGAPASNGAVPALTGQKAEDVVAAMQAFRSGERAATVMDRIAKGFSDDETRAIAAWLAERR